MRQLRVLKSKAELFVRMLSDFNRARVELAVHWLKKSRSTTIVLNVFVFSVLAMVKYRAKVMNKWRSLTNAKMPVDLSHLYDTQLPLRVASEQPRVLVIAETSIAQCLCYRVQQKLDQLTRLGWHNEMMPWYDGEDCKQRIHFADIIIFYRVPALPKPLEVIEYAQQLNKIVIYDVDDLIFDRQRLQEKFDKKPGELSNQEFQSILDGAGLYKKAIETCSYAMTTTATLQTELAALVKQKQCFVLPNALSNEVYEVLALPKPIKQQSKVTLLYGSGTRTHDEDFALVADVICRLLDNYPQLELVIMGYLNLPDSLSQYEDRIVRLPMLDFASYLTCLRQADISIAPLESGVFADAKSEIKWFEAAAFEVPAVVSNTAAYRDVIEHGKTGFIANNSDEWYQALSDLIAKPELRASIGRQAHDVVMSKYAREPMATKMQSILLQIQSNAIEQKQVIAKAEKPHKIMFVNVLYAPDTVGGATIVVERIVNTLAKDYTNQFDLSVVASDVAGTPVDKVREYGWQGVNVTTVGVSIEGDDFELTAHSDKTQVIFQKLVDQHRPDLIHFHCIQRLTGSVVQVARQSNTPYVVTVHDGWWLSEHQFMLDKQNQLINPNQLDPLVALNSSTNLAQSVERTRYLASLLNDAEMIFAVSEYQADIYRNNGFSNVVVNRNGCLPVENMTRPSYTGSKLRIGYLGGVCDHKGYHFMQQAFEQGDYANIQLSLVDIFEPREYQQNEQWGSTEVSLIGQYDSANIDEFYNNIDVLIAPSIWPESFGLVTREAALHGVWTIAADAGGLAEDIIEGETGWVFAMNDQHALQQIMQNLNDKASFYIENRPNLSASNQKIRLLEQQVSELVQHYKNIITDTAL